VKSTFNALLIVVGAALSLTNASAQDLSATELAKLSKPEILEIAKGGAAQELTVEFDTKAIDKDFALKRSSIAAKEEAARNAKTDADRIGINNDIAYNNEAAVSNKTSQLAALKSSVFSPLASLGVTVVQDYSHSSLTLVKVPSLAALESLLKNPLVLKIHATETVKVSANWPSSYSDLAIINATAANASGYTGQNQEVAVLDTGIDESLISTIGGQSRIIDLGSGVLGANEICTTGARSGNGVLGCANGDWQHGTLDIQIVAAVAPSASIAFFQVVDRSGNSNTAYLQLALDNLIALKEQEPTKKARGYWPTLVAANMSVGIPGQIYNVACGGIQIGSELQTLLNDGVVLVVAAGNDGSTSGVEAPACYPGVISVGATYDSTTVYAGCGSSTQHADSVACFSNRSGNYPTVYAPGVNIGASDTYVNGAPYSGTSMAAPHVAGEVAVLRAAPGGVSPNVASLVATIKASGTPVNDGTGISKNRIDISKAIGTQTPPIVAYKMQFTPGALALNLGQNASLSVTCYNQAGTVTSCPVWNTMVWSSANPAVATVNGGIVTPTGVGSTQITMTDYSVTEPTVVAVVTVLPAQILTTMSISPNPLVEGKGMSYALVLSGFDQSNASMPVTSSAWTSANPAIATVSGTGIVTGVAVGATTVTATSGGVSATANVTITSGKGGISPPVCGAACSSAKPAPAAKPASVPPKKS